MNDTRFATVFGNDYNVLRLFLEDPERELYLTEAVKSLKISKMTLYRSLERMVKKGILRSRTDDYRKYYRLKESTSNQALKILMNVDSLIIAQFLKRIKCNCRILLYGSRANGTDGPRSDWDILVISDELDVVAVNKVVRDVERKYDCQINVAMFKTKDYEKIKKERTPYYHEVMRNHYVLRGEVTES